MTTEVQYPAPWRASRLVRAARRWLPRQPLAPWLYLAPALGMLVLWIYAPLGYALWLSFHEWNMLPFSPRRYVGALNYERLLDLPEMGQALRNTFVYLLGLLPLTVVLPVAVAILTHELGGRWRNLYRALIFVPLIIAPVAAAAVWRWLLDPQFGLINLGLQALGAEEVRFLQDPDLAIWTIIWITGWKLIGFSTLIVSASLSNINPALIEAARMDGAGHWAVLWRVIVPNLRAPLAALAILLFISSWNEYFWPLLLTRSENSTVIQIGIQMFLTEEGNQWGPLMAISTLACLPVLLIYVALQRQVIDSFVKAGMR